MPSDDMATWINIQCYSDTPDKLLKALLEWLIECEPAPH